MFQYHTMLELSATALCTWPQRTMATAALGHAPMAGTGDGSVIKGLDPAHRRPAMGRRYELPSPPSREDVSSRRDPSSCPLCL
jgi:hypothetical protein